jgi:hypothetical protein
LRAGRRGLVELVGREDDGRFDYAVGVAGHLQRQQERPQRAAVRRCEPLRIQRGRWFLLRICGHGVGGVDDVFGGSRRLLVGSLLRVRARWHELPFLLD